MTKIMEEKLNTVTGGNMIETAADSQALYEKRLMNEEYNVVDLMFEWNKLSRRVDEGWFNAGIVSVTSPFGKNKYRRYGKEISRDQALKIIGF